MKKSRIIALSVIMIIIAIGICSSWVSAVNVAWDFENGQVPYNWVALYNNANMTVEQEDNGNKYLRLSYSGKGDPSRKYFDVKVADINTDGILQADYDVMYSEIDTEKNGEIHLKQRTGPGSAETALVARVAKHLGYFRTQDENGKLHNINGLNGVSLPITVGRWYSVKVIVDLKNAKHSIYIFDRDTQELLSYSEPVGTINNNTTMNMVTFSSGTDMCIDNVHIYNTQYEGGYIYGSPYVSSATKTKYYLWGIDESGNYTALPSGTTTWTLETPRAGVSLDAATSRIIVGSQPEPGPVVIKAVKETDEGTITARQVVYVSK